MAGQDLAGSALEDRPGGSEEGQESGLLGLGQQAPRWRYARRPREGCEECEASSAASGVARIQRGHARQTGKGVGCACSP